MQSQHSARTCSGSLSKKGPPTKGGRSYIGLGITESSVSEFAEAACVPGDYIQDPRHIPREHPSTQETLISCNPPHVLYLGKLVSTRCFRFLEGQVGVLE